MPKLEKHPESDHHHFSPAEHAEEHKRIPEHAAISPIAMAASGHTDSARTQEQHVAAAATMGFWGHDSAAAAPHATPERVSAAAPTAHAEAAPKAESHPVKKGKGGARNVDLAPLNHNPDKYSDHKTLDPNRVTVDGDQVTTTQATDIYLNQGKSLGTIPAGASVQINAGAICHLNVEGKDEACVLVFRYNSLTGWVPVRHLNDPDKKLVHTQRAIEKRVDEQRKDDPHSPHGKQQTVIAHTAADDGVDSLYVYPRQDGSENKAKYYYGRDDGRVNFLLNLPYTGGER